MEIEVSNVPIQAKVNFDKWAKYTIEKFEFAVSKYKLKDTGTLLNSFQTQVSQEADGRTALISIAFEYYLRMIDMGVGNGVKYDERDNLLAANRAYGSGAGTRRKKKPVYNKIFYSQISRLNELLQKYYKNTAQNIVVNAIR